MKKQVYCNVEIGVNYVTHIYTLAEAGFKDDEYVKKYGDSISKEDRVFLQENADYLSFLRKDHGIFAGQFYFVPSFFNMSTKYDYEQYINAWLEAINLKSNSPIEKYVTDFNNYAEIFNYNDDEWSGILEKIPIFEQIGNIFINNIEYYLNNIWPEISSVLGKKAEEINKNIDNKLIDKWEEVTGYKYPCESYIFTLFYAGNRGPSYNNVSYSKNTANYEKINPSDIDMLSHEFGIHLLLPQLMEKIIEYEKCIPRIQDSKIYGNVSYMALESLAYFYNKKVMKRETTDIDEQNDYTIFDEIYNSLYFNGETPLNIYINGVEKYLDYKGIYNEKQN